MLPVKFSLFIGDVTRATTKELYRKKKGVYMHIVKYPHTKKREFHRL